MSDGNVTPDRVPAPEPDQTIDDEPPEFDMEGKCEWCACWLPADGLCKCPESLRDLEAEHTKCPDGYIQWHSWAEKKAKTHHQIRCPGCDLFKIWVKGEVQDG